uniref:HTH CENPB-type domain-containing protein n=1 Tax=Erpetoichthys calabaricus TaxID=27687 RepID=A0A8C4STC8_ERPCA
MGKRSLNISEKEWKVAMQRIHLSSICAKHRIIQLKIIYRAHLSHLKLSKIFPRSNLRTLQPSSCLTGHMFWACTKLTSFWTKIFKCLSDSLGVTIPPNPLIAVFGVLPDGFEVEKDNLASSFSMDSSKRLRSFMAGEKLKVILEAEKIGNRAAGRKYGVPESCVRDWRQKKEKLSSCNINRPAFRGKSAKFPQVEVALADYIQDRRQLGYAVSTEMIQMKACDIAKERGILITQFKASRGWITRFMRRNGLSIRHRPTISQCLPDAYEEKLLAFQKYIIQLRHQKTYLMGQIGTADQTPVYFENPSNTTVNAVGDKSVPVRTGGREKQWCTVMLTILVDGKKLPPYVIFKWKTLLKNEKFPPGIIIRAQQKGWMDNDLVIDWLKCVWQRRLGSLLKMPNMLVMDSFRGHLTEGVKKRLKDGKTDQVIIPGGMTSLLQPLDVCINWPFKAHVLRMYTEWAATAVHDKMPAGKMKAPTLVQMCAWIIAAWNLIPEDLVVKSFKKCNNALWGSDNVSSEGESESSSKSEDDD